jgi:hypothetical protein
MEVRRGSECGWGFRVGMLLELASAEVMDTGLRLHHDIHVTHDVENEMTRKNNNLYVVTIEINLALSSELYPSVLAKQRRNNHLSSLE